MKNTFHKLALGTLLLALPLVGCDKKLDTEPVTSIPAENALNTSADVQAALRGAYELLGNQYLYGGGFQYYADLLGDAEEVQWGGTFSAPREIFRKSILVNNGFVASTWTTSYQAINMANTVLANIDKVTAVNQKEVEGGAKFVRGTLYFELARFYARDWNDGNPTSNLAVPLVLTPTNPSSPDQTIVAAAQLSRNTVAEVYAQAIKDLTDAETLLSKPSSPTSNLYASSYTASGMLSRVYLQQSRYAEAAAEANKVISSGVYSLVPSLADEFASKTNTSESVFDVQLTTQSGINDLNTFYSSYGRGGDISLNDAYLKLYEKADSRVSEALIDYDSYLTKKFDNTHGNIHLMRLAEMYLTRAEGNLRAGTSVGATPLADVNRVRARAEATPLTSVTLAGVLSERHRELAFEGFLLHDQKRNMVAVGTLPYNSPRLIFPIPQRERDVNSNLVQNEGY
ncbi:RagB/SusD family nutrient uptake outer membrane protein [Hymenobacter sp. GOD-10R]|uniref:RagB/SusD family nutrient uptake outer membrane protein n=1 Tax=Hymenobacter sp. GOD-10R TaxID=3093922 RepID=UPI002D78AC31|nr:RagB/SusD family nutrient uptake outer membrane protein [Hymenobacter sp. GOD-10R]WRQ29805.1 RagB/SusD family nutrient uptake outer membrane protein [Hymenobacter sp. GOD-10R]